MIILFSIWIRLVMILVFSDTSNADLQRYRYRSVPCDEMATSHFALNKFLIHIGNGTGSSPLQCLTIPSQLDPADPTHLAAVVYQPADATLYHCHFLIHTLSTEGLYELEPRLTDKTATSYCHYFVLKLADRTCESLYSLPSNPRKVIASSLWATYYTMLLCQPEPGDRAWTMIQRRVDGSVNFTRSWNDYKVGFGIYDGGEFWFGLENIQRLVASHSYEIQFLMYKDMSPGRIATYEDFSIADESDRYRLSLGKYYGDAGNDFAVHDGAVFDTFDYLPRAANACPESCRGGFWYIASQCHHVNPNGVYGSMQYKKGINWDSFTGFYRSLYYIDIKIRRMP